jgi:hypothetical protein
MFPKEGVRRPDFDNKLGTEGGFHMMNTQLPLKWHVRMLGTLPTTAFDDQYIHLNGMTTMTGG